MKILGVCKKNADGELLVHHIKSAIREFGFVNIEVNYTINLPKNNNEANVFVMSRDLASKCSLSNIMIVDNFMDYKDIKEKLKRLFIVYGFLSY